MKKISYLSLIILLIMLPFIGYSQNKVNLKYEGTYFPLGAESLRHTYSNFRAEWSNGVFISRYLNGKMECKGHFVNIDNSKDAKFCCNSSSLISIKVGEWLFYDEWGNLVVKGNYKNNQADGLWEFHWAFTMPEKIGADDYLIKSVGNYSNGIKVGKWISYYENGKVFREYNFVEGKKSGTTIKEGVLSGSYIMFYENGNLMSKAEYLNGKIVGDSYVYYENGNLKGESKRNFDGNGNSESIDYYDNGQLKKRTIINKDGYLTKTEKYNLDGSTVEN